jgi:hypothetical protein
VAAADDELLCEGYLSKSRGVGKTRIRWFTLTSKRFNYLTEDGVRSHKRGNYHVSLVIDSFFFRRAPRLPVARAATSRPSPTSTKHASALWCERVYVSL